MIYCICLGLWDVSRVYGWNPTLRPSESHWALFPCGAASPRSRMVLTLEPAWSPNVWPFKLTFFSSTSLWRFLFDYLWAFLDLKVPYSKWCQRNTPKAVATLIFIAVLRFNHFSLGSEGENVWHLLLGDETLAMFHSPWRIYEEKQHVNSVIKQSLAPFFTV